jgi:hypothetical protein
VDAWIHRLLLSHDGATDSPTDWEHPPGFDWVGSWQAVRRFQTAAESVLGQPLRVDDSVQDASFFGELFVFEEGAVRPNVTTMVFKIAIRFSAFGRMATIYTNSAQSDLKRYPVERLAALLEDHGFVYVPAEALAEPYDGLTPNMPPDFTWGLRFFDYL